MNNKDKTARYFDRDNDKVNIINIEFIFSAEVSANRLDLRDIRLFVTEQIRKYL